MKYSIVIKALLVLFFVTSNRIHAQPLVPSEGYIRVTGGSVWYKVSGVGKKTPLLLIHGGPGGSSCGFDPLDQLAKDRKIIFYDQLGSGKSEQPDDPTLWNIDRFVEELDKVRKALHLQKVHLLAHSWGAAIAGKYLLDKGTEGIASVIFVGPYLSSKDWIRDTNELRKQLPSSTQLTLSEHERAGTTASAEYQKASGEFYKLFLARNPHPRSNSESCKGSAWNQSIYETMWGNSEFFSSGNLKNFNAARDLYQIRIPTLFLIGEFDEVRESTVRTYQHRMFNANVAVIKNAAHMSMSDEPEQFLSTVDDFLTQTEVSSLN